MAQAERLIAKHEAFWKVALTRAEQLPDIPGEEDMYLTWDANYSEGNDRPQTVIRHGDHVLFSEPASWEAIENRYEAICRVLKEKYGARVRDSPLRRPASYGSMAITAQVTSYAHLCAGASSGSHGARSEEVWLIVLGMLRQQLTAAIARPTGSPQLFCLLRHNLQLRST